MASVELSKPWEAPVDTIGTPLEEAEFRAMYGGCIGDGVIHDTTGTSLRVTCDGTGPHATVALGHAVVGGHWYRLSGDPKVLDMSAVGSATSTGQTRIDVIGLRIDPTSEDSTDRITAVVVPGTPAASASAVAPTLERGLTSSAARVMPLAMVRRPHGTAPTQAQVTDLRPRIGWTLHVDTVTALPPDAPLGSIASVAGQPYARRLTTTGAQWSPAGLFAELQLASTASWDPGHVDTEQTLTWAASGAHTTSATAWPHTTSSVVTAPLSGWYSVWAAIRFTIVSGSPGQRFTIQIRRLATSPTTGDLVSIAHSPGTQSDTVVLPPRLVYLAAGEYVRAYATGGRGIVAYADWGGQVLGLRYERP